MYNLSDMHIIDLKTYKTTIIESKGFVSANSSNEKLDDKKWAKLVALKKIEDTICR